MGPQFLSGAVGDGRPIGWISLEQIGAFQNGGGMVPSRALDIRTFTSTGETGPLSRVDPGFCWLLAFARLFGVPLSLAGVAHLQVAVDLGCLALAHALAWRLSGPVAGSCSALAFGLTTATVSQPFLVAYYFWSLPLALVIAHTGVSLIRSDTKRSMGLALTSYLALAFCAVWLRVAWLPVLPASAAFLVVRQRVWRVTLIVGLLATIAASYFLLIARVSRQDMGGAFTHPRAQLWHTLYIGLGSYGTWDDIQWLDEYAYGIAAAAGVPASDATRYEDFFRKRFFDEVRQHPFRYGGLLMRRVADYAGEALAHTPFLDSISRDRLGAFVLVLSVSLLIFCPDPSLRFVAALLLARVMVWSLVVPPVVPYALECVGLEGVVIAAGAGVGIASGFGRLRSTGGSRRDPGRSSKRRNGGDGRH